ncbi:ADP-ribosylglycohydrolase [Roseimicrobium gellanilyticum]|uniref:ADP-ribosylglycohydrolase n=1 Tax=Roseimicrobium gellanilyticum TaxID=748857 RepID=A0A366HPA7_9BACT|nr:ADP-ribosylglycohydrolase family protein [Roseimicrobium gellanilyticum]RBP44351.1 ADP-ribosylglycohydrolase [Roseimicrobium gellanilyticum]
MASLWGAAVGDALGVPVEFRGRAELATSPVTGMQGYGTHDQPPGTWSDDTSLTLCTIESLLTCEEVDTRDMAERFHRWLVEGLWTAHGQVFDIGIATRQALARFSEGRKPELCGGRQEYDNGNGSLMRMLPVSLWVRDAGVEQALPLVHRVSRITHGHSRTQMVCGYYSLLVWALLEGATPAAALEQAWHQAEEEYKFHEDFEMNWPHLQRLSPSVLPRLEVRDIHSSGYCIHTIEAAVWCLLRGKDFSNTVSSAVNLGDDTDTTACVTGTLAGLHFGLEQIPATWIDQLARRQELDTLFTQFSARLAGGLAHS